MVFSQPLKQAFVRCRYQVKQNLKGQPAAARGPLYLAYVTSTCPSLTPRLPGGISKCQVWGPVLTVALTPRGPLERESESLGGVLWGPVVNPGVTIGPRRSLSNQRTQAAPPKRRETLCQWPITKTPRGLSPTGSCVNSMASVRTLAHLAPRAGLEPAT